MIIAVSDPRSCGQWTRTDCPALSVHGFVARFVFMNSIVLLPCVALNGMPDGLGEPIVLPAATMPPTIPYPNKEPYAVDCIVLAQKDNGNDGIIDQKEWTTFDSLGREVEVAGDYDVDGVIEGRSWFTYDGAGRLRERKDLETTGETTLIRSVYDSADRLIIGTWSTDKRVWRRETWFYDEFGVLRLHREDSDGDGKANLETEWVLSGSNWSNKIRFNDVYVQGEHITVRENRIVLIESDTGLDGDLDVVFGFSYDDRGRLFEIMAGKSRPTSVSYRFEYEGEFLRRILRNPGTGSMDVESFEYDKDGRLIERLVVDHFDPPLRYSYDYDCG